MGIQWQKLWTRIVIWALAEVILSSIGLYNLADYSEYLFNPPMPQLSRNYNLGTRAVQGFQ